MKKVVYLAPIFLLSFLGKGALANQVEHVSKLDEALKEEAIAESNIAAQNTTVEQTQANPKISTNLLNTKRDNNSVADINTYTASKIDAQKTSSVVINNPANNKVHVHYIDANGNAVDNSSHDDNYDYDIDVTKTGQGSYNVPNGYTLNNPDGKYTISGGAFNGTNLKGNTWTVPAVTQLKTDYEYTSGKYLVNFSNQGMGLSYSDEMAAAMAQKPDYLSNLTHFRITNVSPGLAGGTGNMYAEYVGFSPIKKKVVVTPAYTKQQLPVAFVDNNNNIIGMIQNYSGKVGTTQNVSLTVPTGYKLADGASLPTSVTFVKSDAPLLIKVTSNGQTNSVQNPANNMINVNFVDQETHKSVGTAAIDLTKQQQGTNYYRTPNGWATDNNGRYDVGTPFSRGYLTITDDKGNNAQQLILNAKQAQDFFEAFRKGHDTDLSIQAHLPASHPDEINLQDLAYNGVSTYDKENGDRSWENIVYNATKKVIQTEINRHINDNYGQGVFDGYYGKITAKRYNAYTFTDNYHPYDASTNTVTVPVHKTNSFSFADNSGNVKSYSGNTVNVILEHQTKRIDPNNSSLNLDANNQLHLINTSQEPPKQSTTNFKVGYLLDLVTNNKIIDTNNAQALNNTKIFTVNPSLPIGYDTLNNKLLVLNL